MSLPGFSVRRPVFTTMITLMVLVLGVVSLSRLRIDLLPAIEMPTLTVSTEYENASPEVVERLVTTIIEEILATVPGVEEMTSVSSEGQSNVEVRFVWGTDLDAAVADVRSRLEDEISELPEDINRPQIRKFDIGSFPVVIVGISSALDPVELTDLIDKQVRYRFARIPGVAQADLFGGFEREIRVALDPVRIRALELPLDGILDAIEAANIDRPAGEIDQGRYQVTLRAPAEFADLEQIRRTVVAVRNGAAIELGQIAEIKDTYRKLTRVVRVDGVREGDEKPGADAAGDAPEGFERARLGLRIGIRKQADANTVEVSEAILAEIAEVNRDFPQIHVAAVINQGNFIERSIENVARSVLYGAGLAIVVLLFFLRNLRSTVVIALAIPISVVATFALIYFGGFTLNLMTLGGLALGVGLMVDNSIVVLENVFRRRAEAGEAPRDASVRGAGEVAGAIVASTITTLVIFLPLVFVRGVTGLLFKELAYVIVFSLCCSLMVALSLVPMLSSRLLRGAAEAAEAQKSSRFAGVIERSEAMFRRLEDSYRDLLRRALGRRWTLVVGAVLALGASTLLVPLIGTEFLPPSDEGEVRVTGEMEVGTRLSLLDRQSEQMERIVIPAVPEAESYVVSVGASGRRPDEASQSEIRMTLAPAGERARSNTEIADDLRRRLAGQVAGMQIRTRAPQGQFVLERVLGDDEGLSIEVRGFDLETLDRLAARAAEVIEGVEGITDLDVSREAGVPQEMIRIERHKAADVGLSVRDIAEVLEIAVAGREAGDYRTQGNSYRILVQFADATALTLDEILDLTLRAPSGVDVALRSVVKVEPGRGPLLIDRKDQQRVVTISANVAGRDMGSIAAEIDEALAAIPRPSGYEFIIAGTFEQQEEAFAELLISLLLALALVYMVLACQYESLRDPVVVMVSVPLAAIGVLVTLFATGTTLNVQSYIGCIMLGGIVVNNAILLVDQASKLRAEGQGTGEAVAEAGRRRLRPILMTTLTTMLGLLPLALGIGEGADAQAPLARAVIGGLCASTLITLLVVPAVYSLMHPERSAPDDTPAMG